MNHVLNERRITCILYYDCNQLTEELLVSSTIITIIIVSVRMFSFVSVAASIAITIIVVFIAFIVIIFTTPTIPTFSFTKRDKRRMGTFMSVR